MERELLVWFCWFLTVFDCVTSRDTKYVKGVIDAKQNYLNTNFENGSLSPWMDKSDDRTAVRWIVEDFWTISPSLRPPPLEPIGSSSRKYLRLERQLRGAFDVAVLQSPFFLCQPGDILSFSYWIRSRYNQGNNIQVRFDHLFSIQISFIIYLAGFLVRIGWCRKIACRSFDVISNWQ